MLVRMYTLSITLPDDVADALARQARALLLGRRQYVRSLLAAVAQAAESETQPEAKREDESHG